MAVADLLRRFALPTWRWSHFPAGEARDARTGAKLKAMGLQQGWPDFVLLAPATPDRPGGLLHALEAKRQGEGLSDAQAAFAGWCGAHGVPHAVVDDVPGAVRVLSDWGVLRLVLNGAR